MPPANVLMEKDGKRADVCNDASVEHMQALGWKIVPEEPAKPDPKTPKTPATK